MSLSERATDEAIGTAIDAAIDAVEVDIHGDTDLEVTIVARRVDRDALDRLPAPVGPPMLPASPSQVAGNGDVYPVPYPSPWRVGAVGGADAVAIGATPDAPMPRRPLVSTGFLVTVLLAVGITLFSLGVFLLSVIL